MKHTISSTRLAQLHPNGYAIRKSLAMKERFYVHYTGKKGRIVIEQAIREALGLKPGYVAVQKLVGDHVEIYFYPPEHRNSLQGLLAGKSKRTVSSEEWALVRESAWSEESSQNERVS